MSAEMLEGEAVSPEDFFAKVMEAADSDDPAVVALTLKDDGPAAHKFMIGYMTGLYREDPGTYHPSVVYPAIYNAGFGQADQATLDSLQALHGSEREELVLGVWPKVYELVKLQTDVDHYRVQLGIDPDALPGYPVV